MLAALWCLDGDLVAAAAQLPQEMLSALAFPSVGS